MRAFEFISLDEDDYVDDQRADLKDFLIRQQASGKEKVPTRVVIGTMRRLGHSTTVETLLQLIAEIGMVASADENEIRFSDAPDGNDEPEPKDKVQQLAKKAMERDI